MRHIVKSLKELDILAGEFAAVLKAPAAVLVSGDLGAGKTEFCRSVIRRLHGADTLVPSPTFNIVQTYGNDIAHFDLYRMNSPEELEELGLDEYLQNHIVFIEWPDLAKPLVKNPIRVEIRNLAKDVREINIY
ncbi:MAG: tRNA (adenosine(37)-N6)-threonylcarbamoyltransferase complex ATPase subunit type 1 TsaE [Alphaproteobacteria bacterium]|nr:tRNA (adenosine(37)-N6)-threonylcarbamoyltransferase complex ATPase subunit type 1 TsaE [Alphaproteobacteria bacterium]